MNDRPADSARSETAQQLAESDIVEMLGGVRGVIESSIAGVVFALAYSLDGQRLTIALWAAIVSGLVVVLVSVVQRRSTRQALFGFVGIAVMAAFAHFSGQARAFYLPSLIKNAAYAVAYVISIVVGWPLLGLLLGALLGEGTAWRQDPARLRAYQLASWAWAAMFAVRVAVQLPLYLAGKTVWLGIAGIPLGLPLFLFTCWITFVIVARVPLAKRPEDGEDGPDAEDGAAADGISEPREG